MTQVQVTNTRFVPRCESHPRMPPHIHYEDVSGGSVVEALRPDETGREIVDIELSSLPEL